MPLVVCVVDQTHTFGMFLFCKMLRMATYNVNVQMQFCLDKSSVTKGIVQFLAAYSVQFWLDWNSIKFEKV